MRMMGMVKLVEDVVVLAKIESNKYKYMCVCMPVRSCRNKTMKKNKTAFFLLLCPPSRRNHVLETYLQYYKLLQYHYTV